MKDPYYKTHEPPHCPTCDCGADPAEMERLRRNSERYEFIKTWARVLDRANRYEIGISTPSWNAPHGCSFDEGLDAWMRE